MVTDEEAAEISEEGPLKTIRFAGYAWAADAIERLLADRDAWQTLAEECRGIYSSLSPDVTGVLPARVSMQLEDIEAEAHRLLRQSRGEEVGA